MENSQKKDVFTTRKSLYNSIGICLIIIVVIHIFPKSHTHHSTLRLLLTVSYFGTILYLLWTMLNPRAEYVEKLFKWKFEDCPVPMEKAWKLYLHTLNQTIKISVILLMFFVASIGLNVLTPWFVTGKTPMVMNLLVGVAFVALICLPFLLSKKLSDLYHLKKFFEEMLVTSDFKSRDLKGLDNGEDSSSEKAVVVKGHLEFKAGNMDWSWEDFYKNCIIFGQTGTGKTLCVLNVLLDALLGSGSRYEYKPSALILDPKGDFAGKIQYLCKKYNRDRDLLILDPKNPKESITWNPFDSHGDELEISARFAAVLACMGIQSTEDTYWIDSAKKFIRHSIALIRYSNEHNGRENEPPSLAEISEMAADLNAIEERTSSLDISDARCGQCLAFFAQEWLDMAEKTKTTIQSFITNMIDPFLMEPYLTLFSGRSSVRISDMVNKGKILYVNMPIAEKESMSKMICTFIKLEYFREVLIAVNKKRPSFFMCDEFQSFFTVTQGKGDADFFERSRQSNHANIIATQNMFALLKQTSRKDPVMNLLGNCAIKIFLRNTETETNNYASALFDQDFVGVMAKGSSGGGLGKRRTPVSTNYNISYQYEAMVRPEKFTKLAIPSRRDGVDYAESYVHLSSRGKVDWKRLQWKVHPI